MRFVTSWFVDENDEIALTSVSAYTGLAHLTLSDRVDLYLASSAKAAELKLAAEAAERQLLQAGR